MKKVIHTLIAGAAVVSATQAQAGNTGRPYIGFGAASADHVYSVGNIAGTKLDSDGWKASGKVFGGFEFTPNLGVEAGYTDFRSANFSYRVNGNAVNGISKGYGAYVAAKYNVPVNQQLSAYGKLGLGYSNREIETDGGLRINDNDTGAYAALGVEFKLNQNISAVAEYERYGKSKNYGAKADVVTIGVKYSF